MFLGIIRFPVNPLQPENANSPIEFTVAGIINLPVKPVQFIYAHSPIVVTFAGIIKSPINPLQAMYLQPIITQYFIDNKSEIWLLFLIAHSKR